MQLERIHEKLLQQNTGTITQEESNNIDNDVRVALKALVKKYESESRPVYTALEVAEYTAKRLHNKGYYISNLHIQPYLYFIQAEFMVSLGHPAFNDSIETCGFGVYVPNVYNYYARKGIIGTSIYKYGEDIPELAFEKASSEYIKVANEIIDECYNKDVDVYQHIIMHQRPYKEACNSKNHTIRPEALKEYFKEDF